MQAPELTPRFDRALRLARELHANQTRKGTSIPYLAHLLAVTALVLEEGGDEDLAIAALLHDAVEDQGGVEVLQVIRREFGDRVADIVDGLTDTYESPKPPWRPRKERYIAHLLEADPDVVRVSLADKLHNARSIRADLRLQGDDLWDRFRGGKQGTLWYYHRLVEVFRQITDSPLSDELARVVADIEALSE